MAVTSSGNRCGSSWADANQNCNNFCASDGECTIPDNNNTEIVSRCFSGLQKGCPVSLKRCGKSFADANENCGAYCLNSDWCTGEGELCYDDLADICDFRCGSTWANANKGCSNTCRTGDSNDCPNGQICFGQLEKDCSNSPASTIQSSQYVWLLLIIVMLKLMKG
jgi:hypothetical protein